MKTFLLLLCIQISSLLMGQSTQGSIVFAANAGKSPFTLGEIFVDSQSGLMGTISFLINTSVELIDENTEDHFLVFPNPTKGNFTIKTPLDYDVKSLAIIDTKGKTIFLQDEKEYDLSNILPGIYVLWINNEKALKIIKK